MDDRNLYRAATDQFAARVHLIGGRWDAATPCAGWNVRALVHHVVEEERWAPPLFAGATIDEVGDRLAGDLLGADPVGAFDRAAAEALTAVDDASDGLVHLSFADTPRAAYTVQLGVVPRLGAYA